MVVGGEVVTLKGIEESSSLVIAEMPINVSLCIVACSFIYRDKWTSNLIGIKSCMDISRISIEMIK